MADPQTVFYVCFKNWAQICNLESAQTTKIDLQYLFSKTLLDIFNIRSPSRFIDKNCYEIVFLRLLTPP